MRSLHTTCFTKPLFQPEENPNGIQLRSIRRDGKAELWDLVRGTTRPLPDSKIEGQHTVVPLQFAAAESFFKVSLNGKNLGVIWTAPWRVNLTSAVRPKNNKLEIKVTNVWVNRLVGDE